jgi:hypothetical protein
MLSEIEQFVNWVRRRNSNARTWKDYGYDLRQADLPIRIHQLPHAIQVVAQKTIRSYEIPAVQGLTCSYQSGCSAAHPSPPSGRTCIFHQR